jgi:hypothetical protein
MPREYISLESMKCLRAHGLSVHIELWLDFYKIIMVCILVTIFFFFLKMIMSHFFKIEFKSEINGK